MRLKRDQRASPPQQWGLPPPPPPDSTDYSQWSGAADSSERRRWQPSEPAADYRQPVRPNPLSHVSVCAQGWRLDPLLLFGQLLTAGTATAFAVESLRLRDIISEEVGRFPVSRRAWLPRLQSYAIRVYSFRCQTFVHKKSAGFFFIPITIGCSHWLRSNRTAL